MPVSTIARTSGGIALVLLVGSRSIDGAMMRFTLPSAAIPKRKVSSRGWYPTAGMTTATSNVSRARTGSPQAARLKISTSGQSPLIRSSTGSKPSSGETPPPLLTSNTTSGERNADARCAAVSDPVRIDWITALTARLGSVGLSNSKASSLLAQRGPSDFDVRSSGVISWRPLRLKCLGRGRLQFGSTT
jgi:hypothetical protein